jgi:hypothetical protein
MYVQLIAQLEYRGMWGVQSAIAKREKGKDRPRRHDSNGWHALWMTPEELSEHARSHSRA